MRKHRTLGLSIVAAGLILTPGVRAQQTGAPEPTGAPAAAPSDTTEAAAPADPRVGLAPGVHDAGVAAEGLELVASVPKPDAFVAPGGGLMALLYANSDLAFQGDLAFVGNFHGFNVYDVSDPSNPTLRTSFVCPGGQGDLSIHGNLLFMSVEMPNGRVDCEQGTMDPTPRAERFRGVRIFDVSDLDRPVQVATIQTCRGSHTHTLVTDPDDDETVWIYVSGVANVRSPEELPGCVSAAGDPESALFRIEVIEVPLDAPEDAEIVSTPRIFADRETGEIAGLWEGGAHGPETQSTSRTDQCHDITAYPEIGLAAGACSGNGILLDISDPANPVRIDEVVDPNFAYWHSATFDNDASKVVFTDEWGGGMQARCRASDPVDWGANAIFDVTEEGLTLKSYYKLPAPQSDAENCVAHNGSLIPVPGRDVMVQAWYQGGISIFDFTDSESPVEIAWFDRGPMSLGEPVMGGQWSAYWYDGHVYGSEIGRGLDVLALTPSEHLTANEIAAARLVRYEEWNPQTQRRVSWPASPAVARAYLDQIARRDPDRAESLRAALDRAEALEGDAREEALGALAERAGSGADEAPADVAKRLRMLERTLRGMASAS